MGSIVDVDNLILDEQTKIGDYVKIKAKTLHLRYGAKIEDRCQITNIDGGTCEYIDIGEHTILGHDSKIVNPVTVIGDYTKIHNHCLLNGRKPVIIGHNVWVGQNCILNSEEDLTIGNNVCIGPYSSLYTHGYFGDMLEGCQVFNKGPIILEDDVWIIGSYNSIYPGVTLGRKSLVMSGSIVTKDVLPNHTVVGSPAKDVTDKVLPYKFVRTSDKLSIMYGYIREFQKKYKKTLFKLSDLYMNSHQIKVDETIFDLVERTYTRTRSELEVSFIKFLSSYRARFVPTDRPQVTYGHST